MQIESVNLKGCTCSMGDMWRRSGVTFAYRRRPQSAHATTWNWHGVKRVKERAKLFEKEMETRPEREMGRQYKFNLVGRSVGCLRLTIKRQTSTRNNFRDEYKQIRHEGHRHRHRSSAGPKTRVAAFGIYAWHAVDAQHSWALNVDLVDGRWSLVYAPASFPRNGWDPWPIPWSTLARGAINYL